MNSDFPLLKNFFTNVLDYYKEGQHIRWNEVKPKKAPRQKVGNEESDDCDDDADEEFLISSFKSSVSTTPCLYFVISNLADIHLVGALRADEMG